MDMKTVLERLARLEQVIETSPMSAIRREIDLLRLDIEVDCRREGVELVTK